eukprot:Gregarina_sp_Poly_1__10968@NODE_866_length_5920_cov_30_974372_g626_i0_p4_GENE_NODE_866_length_5920_cov_30_974372_g626_i0NODE_866_length_5920_cov_30_974372_g626_i0_p4_ORF_typecomplete_len133_score14_37AP_endonuc_2/PF01261_24/0_13DUF1389/PF07146_11/0_19_NODE_866_length_5920_cov_30_974372_g626_i049405338
MSFVTDLDDGSGSGPAESEVGTQVAVEGAEYVQSFGRLVRDTDLSIQELCSRVSILLDDVTSAKSTKDTLDSLRRSRETIERAKALNRKLACVCVCMCVVFVTRRCHRVALMCLGSDGYSTGLPFGSPVLLE